MEIAGIKEQFPILNQKINEKNLVYLDNSATSQKPQEVIDAISTYYTTNNSNVNRGLHTLSAKADKAWTQAHSTVEKYINANPNEIFFVRNATEGLNWVTNTIGKQKLQKDDVVIISEMEHHSNIIPWKILQKEIDFILETIPLTSDYQLDFKHLSDLVEKYGNRIKIVSLIHKSNVLGVTIDTQKVKEIITPTNAIFVLDGAQSIPHQKIDVKELGCDVFIFSGHKVYGPTGTGAVYAKKDLLGQLEPWFGGGDMVKEVKENSIVWNDLPMKFEAGTPDIAGGIGLGSALNWLSKTIDEVGGWQGYLKYQSSLTANLYNGLKNLKGVKMISPEGSDGIVTFTVEHIHPHDIATLLDERGIAIRAGYHCSQPLHEKLGLKGSVRASLGIYNTKQDVEAMVEAMREIVEIF